MTRTFLHANASIIVAIALMVLLYVSGAAFEALTADAPAGRLFGAGEVEGME